MAHELTLEPAADMPVEPQPVEESRGCCQQRLLDWRGCCQRRLETKRCGFKPKELLLGLLSPALQSLLDLVTDIHTIITFYQTTILTAEGVKPQWWVAGIVIEVTTGVVGWLYLTGACSKKGCATPQPTFFGWCHSLGWSDRQLWVPALLVCVLGLERVVLAVVVLRLRANPKEAIYAMRQMGLCNSFLESLLQTALLVYVQLRESSAMEGVEMGWSRKLKLCWSLVSAGLTMFSWETAGRDDLSSPLYKLVKTLVGACEVAVFFLQPTLLAVKVMISQYDDRSGSGSHGTTPQTVSGQQVALVWYVQMIFGLYITVSQIHGHLTKKSTRWTHRLHHYGIVLWAGMIVIFSNDFTKSSNNALKFFGYLGIVAASLSILLTPLSWLLHPVRGRQGWRKRTWEETVADDSKGMTDEQIARAKALAVWEWADLFRNGILEREEIDRLEADSGCQCEILRDAVQRGSRLRNSGNTALAGKDAPRCHLTRAQFLLACEGQSEAEQWFDALKLDLIKKERLAHKVAKWLFGAFDDPDLVEARDKILQSPSRRLDGQTTTEQRSVRESARQVATTCP